MKRETTTDPGHDCIYGKCRFKPPCTDGWRGHGISCDTWHFHIAADDDLTGLCLQIRSGVFPSTIPDSHWKPDATGVGVGTSEGTDLSLYARFFIDPDDIKSGTPAAPASTPLWECERVFSTGLGAVEFAAEHFDKNMRNEQPESFWQALEKKFIEWDKDARSQRADDEWQRCNSCDGRGIVRK